MLFMMQLQPSGFIARLSCLLACLSLFVPVFAVAATEEDAGAAVARESRQLERRHQRAVTALEQEQQAAVHRLESAHRNQLTELKQKQEAALTKRFQEAGADGAASLAALLGGGGFQLEERLLQLNYNARDLRAIEREFAAKLRSLEREYELALQTLQLRTIEDSAERGLTQRRQKIAHEHALRRDRLEQKHAVEIDRLTLEAEEQVVEAEAAAASYLMEKIQSQVKNAGTSGNEVNPFALMGDPGYLERTQKVQRIRDDLSTRLGELELEIERSRTAINHDEEDALDDLL